MHATKLVLNIACFNDVAERGVARIPMFNATTDKEPKQYMFQVVERHCRDFSKCNRDEVKKIVIVNSINSLLAN